MGYEFKILVELSERERGRIALLLRRKEHFRGEVDLEHVHFFEFSTRVQMTRMPDTSLSFEADGIYVCQYSGSDVWHGLDDLKDELTELGKKIEVLEL